MSSLLGPDDPPAYVEIPGAAPILLVCDHASHRVPRALGGLGLAPKHLGAHIAWDIGAAEVTRHLAPLLGAMALICGYSRLVVDCNRDPDDPSSMPALSDGIAIPGNAALSPDARADRLAAIFTPYHAAIARALDRMRAGGRVPALISIHSFTPMMDGLARPWHAGILWDADGRIAAPLMAALAAEPGLIIGNNQPYSAREPRGYTVSHHAAAAGLAHVAIELRQDLVGDAEGAAVWARRLARVLGPILRALGVVN
ncbi:MAG: N-formylglutamate amidohydrolase [Stellaceae bacterium]